MKKNSVLMAAVLTAVAGFTFMTAKADAANVASGKPVSIMGTFFAGGSGADLSTVVDGIFRPRSTQWQDGTVWWSQNPTAPQYVQVDLGGLHTIYQFTVQVDDNDEYTLQYQDQNGNWNLAWEIPNKDAEGWGMQTRPNPANDLERYTLPTAITAQSLRLFHTEGTYGDGLYSVSEIQAFGAPVPEPVSAILGLMGITGLFGGARRNKK